MENTFDNGTLGEEKGNELEQAVSQTLESGDARLSDPVAEAVSRLSPRYEIRIKTLNDPIVEEIRQYRNMGEEVDNRYDAYMEAAGRNDGDEHDESSRLK